jgi:DNA-binding response OmpR family regulator
VGPAQNPVSVVIIDDNTRSLEFVSAALSRPGVQIFTAAKPADGLALVSLHRPLVVLTDLIMPGMSGLDVLERVKQFDPTISVVIMSARESGGSPAKAFEQGATDYLKKPISVALLRERVGRLIQAGLIKKTSTD